MKHGHRFKHGFSGINSPVYHAWKAMRARCNNPNGAAYDRYGARGIKVCERWESFENFYADMGDPPSPKHSLDRFPDNDGSYEKDNCRWATPKEQANNRRRRKVFDTPPVKRGEENNAAKLTWEQVEQIRSFREEGVTLSFLAEMFGIARSNAGMICRGKAWVQR